MSPTVLSVAMGTIMFTLFGAGLGAAWSGVVFDGSYSRGAFVGGLATGVFALLAGTVWMRRFAPLGVVQLAAEFQRKGKVDPTPLANPQALAYRGLSALMVPVLSITFIATVIAAVVRAF